MAIGVAPRVAEKRGLQELEDLFLEHYELVYRTAYSIVNNTADAEDVLQNVFLRLMRREVAPDFRKNVKGYFYRAAVNLSLDTIRSKRRYELVGDTERLESAVDATESESAERLHRQLVDALAGLTPEAVHILILRYVHDYSDAHIARLLGTSRTVIAVRLFRSRARPQKADARQQRRRVMTSRHSFADRLRALMDRGFAPYRRLTPGQVELSGMRVLQQLRKDPMWDSASMPLISSALRRKPQEVRTRWVPMTVAATLVVAAVATAILWRPAGDALFTVVEGAVLQGDPPSLLRSFGETGTIRSNGGGGAVLALTDESRIEMRSHSELSLERGDDGFRVRLNEGGIIVNAAKQRSGHFYVQTKDMTVSVDGTVFVVNADAKGSRVGVVEGEVRVQQGATETKLRPGERVATGPNSEAFTVASELAWSRRAKEFTALLQRQSAAEQRPAVVAAPQAPKEPRVAFEVISIRPSGPAPAPAAGVRGGGGGLNSRPAPSGCVFDSFGYSYQLDPRRLAVNRTTLLHLVGYTIPGVGQEIGRRQDVNCGILTKIGLLSGGPDWIRTDVWDVVAGIPEGVFTSAPKLTDPALQQMLKTMLSERFGLVVRRETRDIPVYLLKVGKDGPKFNGLKPIDPNRSPMFMGPDGKLVKAADAPPPPEGAINILGGFAFGARNVSMEYWANHLFGIDGRPVFDRTGLTGRYDFYYDDPAGRPRTLDVPPAGVLDRAVIKAMGFELEESKATYDAWVIERAEKPREN